MTKGTHLLRSALLALLGLVVISGASFAGGDLFDGKTYKDCPYQTRLRDGQIADLAVARDSDDADHVNVSWTATDAASWGLGPNAYTTRLVVLLDDGDLNTEKLHLGARKVTFEEIETGKSVKVQMAIVVDHADGNYLISDILEQSINQSLSKPAFSTGWHRITNIADGDTTTTPAFEYQSEAISTKAGSMMYYIGYNENFASYKKGSFDITSTPSTPRLRVGLAHSAEETSSERDDVKFEAYVIRILDEDSDVVDEGDDVETIENNYGTGDWDHDNDANTAARKAPRNLWVTDFESARPTFSSTGTVVNLGGDNAIGGIGDAADTDYGVMTNVRIVDGSKITVGMHLLPDAALDRPEDPGVEPSGASIIKVGFASGSGDVTVGDVYAMAPDEYRDLPIDTMTSDETYTIEAWAINEDDEVISPKATIKVRPKDALVTLANSNGNRFQDYKTTTAVELGTVKVTEFTVLK